MPGNVNDYLLKICNVINKENIIYFDYNSLREGHLCALILLPLPSSLVNIIVFFLLEQLLLDL